MTRIANGPRLFFVDQPFDARLAISERPMGFDDLDDDVAGWRASGIGAVVSMLESDEAEDLGLAHEGSLCISHGIDFISCPISDHGVPDDDAVVEAAARRALDHLTAGRRVAAHCFAGIGRSPLLTAAVLVLHGVPAGTAWEKLKRARGLRLPDTKAQLEWIHLLEKRLAARR